MFDIGFGELILVLVIGLVVLGPERLPVAVKTVAGWIRVMRSMAANVQNELTQELKLQELQDNLKKMEEQAGKAISPELKASMDDLKEAADTLRRSYQEPVNSLKKQLDPEALADQEIEIPPARPASAGTPAVQNPSPAAPSPASAEEIPASPSPEVRDSEPTPSPVTAAASDSQKH
ncbi:Sec-independent protein translocase subunit TatB [Morganella morganii]|uniref:Sec-independent protein translocase protein TatB n=1 Tax=Morganella morganii TaxID=582 RepID=UPI000D1E6A2D|nr:Sec-independent protein translocase protein TatB [Morganella morganii]HAE76256.1 twin-arginine translocase subunit TatB [Morganella sp. (in: enterobacteria)]QXO43098.1 Sec-independent protein translocase subunit TatB [Morganella morganii]QXO46678.1 Sec-independent protein translocase subunit TatB [Morganella morganii]QXO50436.1 Sec-independent protein translocase subunit TatB [Morganella morganii]QXO54286.1 Sec-independent protein translocase subunit TatB [Morganella morganii]